MADLVVVVPSRGRPAAARELAEAFAATCTAATRLVFAVDDDDPTWRDYPPSAWTALGEHNSMVEALNVTVGKMLAAPHGPRAVGFMGDDHRPRTVGWDRAYLDALADMGGGIVYGDDLLQRGQLPTQCAMTSDIVRALGWMAPPMLRHMYVDNFWLALGRALGRIRYLPDVVVEHLHPFAGKAAMDAGYERVNAPAVYSHDEAAFAAYLRDSFPADVARVRALWPAAALA